jgi:hypothetical protein
MLRYLTIVPLLGALTLLTAADATAQLRRAPPPARREVSLAGTYENISSGGTAYIHRRRGGYTFVNEHGAEAFFAPAGPGRLEMLQGEWNPTTARVQKDRRGRTLIRFDSGEGKPGYWLRVD